MVKWLVVIMMLLSSITFAQDSTLASWYGSDHHGRLMANGKRFDKNAFTAAHKTLKFGTVVRVVNPDNSKEVMVRITDRGPFIKGRGLDLSEAAFKAIADLKRGVIRVRYEIVNP